MMEDGGFIGLSALDESQSPLKSVESLRLKAVRHLADGTPPNMDAMA